MLFFFFFLFKGYWKKYHWFQKNIKLQKQFTILIINENIGLISEGSCDTEDWSKDADNSALHHKNKLF